MNRFVCIHGHFYQPPRENPWLEEVELQDSAYPYHDWNERVAAECYAPNALSRILDADKRVVDIVNNYARMSFNFGPSLMMWMERHAPDVYEAVLEADRKGRELFSGHGGAIAQVYNHMIMPLANSRDKRTQVVWGITDFERRFGRRPEGMWLAETAVDIETLEVLAGEGIAFTILAPHQARRFRAGREAWHAVDEAGIDTRMPYRCVLPSGASIAIFFYDGAIAHEIAFGDLLSNGERFAQRIVDAFDAAGDVPQLVNVATDGETYGHHHTFGDMTLAYGMRHLEAEGLARITVYAEFLERHPPLREVEIRGASSWSCFHGVERWRSACGCVSGANPGWQQEWRAPLRGAMDWLRDSLAAVFEERLAAAGVDPWRTRDAYIACILDRSPATADAFVSTHAPHVDRVEFMKLMEMQRHAMLMFTSCGWFFDEISGLETLQVMLYAARAMQLAREIAGLDLTQSFVELLSRASSNINAYGTGAQVYEKLVSTAIIDFLRVGAHFAIASLFEEVPERIRMYSYEARPEEYDRHEMGRQKLVVGRTRLRSAITGEEAAVVFAALTMGDHNIIGGVRRHDGDGAFTAIRNQARVAFQKSDIPRVIGVMDEHFGTHSYSLWHLFKDEQRKVMDMIVAPTVGEIQALFEQFHERSLPVMQAMSEMRIPLPPAFRKIMEYVLNAELRETLATPPIDLDRLARSIDEVGRWSIAIDEPMLRLVTSNALYSAISGMERDATDCATLERIEAMLGMLKKLPLQLDLWRAQNAYFLINADWVADIRRRSGTGDACAARWAELYDSIGAFLNMHNGHENT